MSDALKTVLVVDDAPSNLQLVSGLLRGRYKIKAATSGEKALRIAAAQPAPDLILLDVMMPEMDGHEVCRRLKADPVTRGIPVIFLTATVNDEERARGLELGAVDYLAKPVDPEKLEASLEANLRS